MYLAIGLPHCQLFKGKFQFVNLQLNFLEMVMRTTGFNQEGTQLIVKAELNVVSPKTVFLPWPVNKSSSKK